MLSRLVVHRAGMPRVAPQHHAESDHRHDVASLGPVAVDAASRGAPQPHCAGSQRGPVESEDRDDARDSRSHGRQVASRVRDVGDRRPAGCAAGRPPAEARARGLGAHPGARLSTAGGLQSMDASGRSRAISELPPATVHDVLVASDLQPHRMRTFTFSPDPDFEAKLLDIVGLYLHPPENALVLCVDEKPGSKPSIGRNPACRCAPAARARTNEYVRNGTQALIAALDVATGRVIGHVKDRRTSVNFLRFMDDVVAAFPRRDPACGPRQLEHSQEPRGTPLAHAAYPCAAIITRRRMRPGSISSRSSSASSASRESRSASPLEGLASGVSPAVSRAVNQTSAPFTWTTGPDKLQPIIDATKAAHPGLLPKRRRNRPRVVRRIT